MKPTTSIALFLMFLLVAQSAALTVTNDVNATMLTSESNGEDTFSVSVRNGSSWSTPVSLDSTDNVGYYSSLAIDSNDNLHVTYRDGTNGNLEYMTFNGSSWSTPVSLDSTDNVGRQSSLAIDSNDNLHVTYLDNTNDNLEYMTYDGSSWSTPVSLDSTDNVGSDSSLAIDSSDNLHVTYHDNTNGNLEYMMAGNNTGGNNSGNKTPSFVLITAFAVEEDVITISVNTVMGRIYRLWVSDDLENWSIWGNTNGTGGTSNFSFDKTSPAALSLFGTSELPKCFFMVELIPEP